MVQHLGSGAPGDVCLVWSHWTRGHTRLVSEDPRQLAGTLDYSQTHLLFWKTSLRDYGLSQSVWLTIPTYPRAHHTKQQDTRTQQPTNICWAIFCCYDSIHVTLPPRFFPPLLKTSYQRHLYGMLSKPYSCVVFAQNSAFYVSLHAFQNNCKLFCSIEIVNLIFEMDISIWERSSLNQICCFKSSWLSIEYWLKIQFFH